MFYRTFYKTKIKGFVTERVLSQTAVLMCLISCVMIRRNGNEKFVGAVSVWKKIATDLDLLE